MLQLPELVQALLNPEAYPDIPPRKIDLVQTQMSFVFLTDDYVYKIKKPVNLGYLDYTTLEKRLFFCQREVELNQRLCPDDYLGVIPVTQNKDKITLNGKGNVIEYAVKMCRLPQSRMLDTLLIKNKVSPQMIASVAKRLAEFHRQAETDEDISAFGSLETISHNSGENFSQTIEYIGRTISQASYRHIKDYSDSFIRANSSLFHKRVTDQRIRDCHGDLHIAHICFTDNICIYDCIEFNDRFRYCDVAAEVAFLAMDLDHYDRADLSRNFVDAYISHSEDTELTRLLNFYKCYRAYVRGKVEGFKLNDKYIPPAESAKAEDTARSYFELAESYIE
ncbi:hypothetical protein ACFLXP_00960 [Chloroflexota bacterium]